MKNIEQEKTISLSEFVRKYDMALLNGNEDKGLFVHLAYTVPSNVSKSSVYKNNACLLRREAYEGLLQSLSLAKEAGYGILVWDAWRPREAQEIFWNESNIEDEEERANYIANPYKGGSVHTTGGAVDLTLVRYSNHLYEPIVMPTCFDDLTSRANMDAPCDSEEALRNKFYLDELMQKGGFETYNPEWWHKNFSTKFPLINENFSLQLKR